MKKLKNMLATLMAVVFVFVLYSGNTLVVSAAEPTTYCLNYINGEWRFLKGSTWDENGYNRELYYFNQDVKEGDLVVVVGTGSNNPLNIPVALSNLTINKVSSCVVNVPSVVDCYVLGGSTCAINGNITNAYVYNTSTCNFNNNVGYLEAIGTTTVSSCINVLGTVDHVCAKGDNNQVFYDLYSFQANTLCIVGVTLKTDSKYYSTTAPATTTTPNTTSNSGEYDDVPKTGDISYFPTIPSIIGFVSVIGFVSAAGFLLCRYGIKQK